MNLEANAEVSVARQKVIELDAKAVNRWGLLRLGYHQIGRTPVGVLSMVIELAGSSFDVRVVLALGLHGGRTEGGIIASGLFEQLSCQRRHVVPVQAMVNLIFSLIMIIHFS